MTGRDLVLILCGEEGGSGSLLPVRREPAPGVQPARTWDSSMRRAIDASTAPGATRWSSSAGDVTAGSGTVAQSAATSCDVSACGGPGSGTNEATPAVKRTPSVSEGIVRDKPPE